MDDRVNIRYSALNKDDYQELPKGAEALEDLRFKYMPQEKLPWRSISLALFLLALGTVFLVISDLVFSSHMDGDNSQAYNFLLLGVLLFLPGFYETRIAYYSWRGCKGYTFSRIPVH